MDYHEANRKGLERLQKLANRLTDEQLALPVGDGWTIAAILAHLAFWDFRALVLVKRWKLTEVERSPIDTDAVNDAVKPLCQAIEVREAANLAIQAAEAVDTELENLPEPVKAGIENLVREGKFRLDRSIHRNEHIDEIERVLAEARGKKNERR
jgi:hypothetical protein